MSMTLRRARQVIKQRNVTAQRILKALEAGPIDDQSLFELLRKRGWKEGHGMLQEMIVALTATGKVRTNKRVHRLATEDEPMPQRPVKAKLADVWPDPAKAGIEKFKKQLAHAEQAAESTTTTEPEQPKENDMDLSTLTPDQMLAMAAQMQKMAEAKKRELDPELLRQMLEAGQSVLDASDLLVEATDRLRRALDAVREARSLPTTKKV